MSIQSNVCPVEEFKKILKNSSQETIRKMLMDNYNFSLNKAYDISLSKEELEDMAMREFFIEQSIEEEDAEMYLDFYRKLSVGVVVELIVDHHTDELLLETIEDNEVQQLVVSDINWETGQVWFESTEGFAYFSEIVLW